MAVPDLTTEQVQTIIPEASNIELLDRCGQKIVFTGIIEGENLKEYHRSNGNLSVQDLVKLADNISDAINEIWKFSKIHRDIKPINIMHRSLNDDLVLQN